MKNVVVTGMGIVSCIGNGLNEVLASLKNGKSGITLNPIYKEMGFRSHVSGSININLSDLIDRKVLRFMSEASGYAYLAVQEALINANLNLELIDTSRIGIVAGSGGASSAAQIEASDITREKGPKRIGPYAVTKTMGSTVSAILGTTLKLKGVNYSISSACSTSAHCIGHAAELIQLGKQDIVLAGGGEQEHWTSSSMFDAMGALSSKYNETPEKASRAFDANRDGFVIAGGSGMLILEEEEHAIKRNAPILARLTGYCANSDGYDMVSPSGEGATRCMGEALSIHGSQIDYINAHGTSTPVGDLAELVAIKNVFGSRGPIISSTKSLTGHSLGATGAQEAIYSILMMQNDFIAPSINIDNLVEEAEGLQIAQTMIEMKIKAVMSNSFGFGGTNASLIFSK
ncbi:MAG: 3-oxoacyl-ACP synthase [SAR86 cluster bacterium BACL1 MAG-120920-bin57]|jgi:3-oxoacyl-[acyl-carrier-protein] synthase I|uniref:3-oxoacyl-[acyl-carrier-protein] synthase 1 n=2 Tax=SAR86 cluster TaxID=62672 RepID=A0A0R2UAS7_9GAMM|nr:MAG: 3-oxoacyl-ACP synthase [SAR86 cluster bacterium BACL1 MAG-120507-bin14]KRO40125.1 MAG: 3-oxoacyl-ACP synthase [SAR86 cluster bacterium BACL1 MAG-120920-bin57]KRO96168.1 MAG: 3-oxoacyl-ACP synthase [SAR86 cluster bacterium BACL1 MAG-120820-bin45]KRO97526.1 MAG: 3-oxoacyl-ACP synthase [SAR86 cluster bacterium BACL1 MAG-120828-bin5]KRO98511.1 MAG: 3-oxoacyl-ACP synthase [SAR86 cluster bacterium BACL1 MAG-120823-bin87]KRO99068.1 MAG: 3-oxoacyl-ACP synthase [SAR86 cluster bacterium BACL1 MA